MNNENNNENNLNTNNNVTPENNINNTNNVTPEDNKPKKSLNILIIIVILIALIVGLFVFVFNKKSNNSSNEDNKASEATFSNKWESGEFMIDNVKYSLNLSLDQFTKKGWKIEENELENLNKSSLNSGEKTKTTTKIVKGNSGNIFIGFANLNNKEIKPTDGVVWSIVVDNMETNIQTDFTLPGNIKSGTKLSEIEKLYGQPFETQKNEEKNYMIYTYNYNYSVILKTVFYNEELKGFVYQKY